MTRPLVDFYLRLTGLAMAKENTDERYADELNGLADVLWFNCMSESERRETEQIGARRRDDEAAHG